MLLPRPSLWGVELCGPKANEIPRCEGGARCNARGDANQRRRPRGQDAILSGLLASGAHALCSACSHARVPVAVKIYSHTMQERHDNNQKFVRQVLLDFDKSENGSLGFEELREWLSSIAQVRGGCDWGHACCKPEGPPRPASQGGTPAAPPGNDAELFHGRAFRPSCGSSGGPIACVSLVVEGRDRAGMCRASGRRTTRSSGSWSWQTKR